MQIYSWNMLYRNRDLGRGFKLISESVFDVFCLQEVPETFLERLRTLPYSIAVREDREALYRGTFERHYLVTLSRHPIVEKREITYRDYWSELPWRTRAFVDLMPNRYFTRIRNRGALVTDLAVKGKTIRVYNLHLILARPAWRLEEFDTALASRDETPTVVCGDFNILESWRMNILNWILGGSSSDAFLIRRERQMFEAKFNNFGLVNALKGQVTHPFSHSQLDHILLSNDFHIEHARPLASGFGSDHLPVFVETQP